MVVTVVDQAQPYWDGYGSHGGTPHGGGGGGEAGGGGGQRLLVPIVLEALPESCLRVPRKVDLGTVTLDSSTPSSFEVHNLSAGAAPLR